MLQKNINKYHILNDIFAFDKKYLFYTVSDFMVLILTGFENRHPVARDSYGEHPGWQLERPAHVLTRYIFRPHSV